MAGQNDLPPDDLVKQRYGRTWAFDVAPPSATRAAGSAWGFWRDDWPQGWRPGRSASAARMPQLLADLPPVSHEPDIPSDIGTAAQCPQSRTYGVALTWQNGDAIDTIRAISTQAIPWPFMVTDITQGSREHTPTQDNLVLTNAQYNGSTVASAVAGTPLIQFTVDATDPKYPGDIGPHIFRDSRIGWRSPQGPYPAGLRITLVSRTQSVLAAQNTNEIWVTVQRCEGGVSAAPPSEGPGIISPPPEEAPPPEEVAPTPAPTPSPPSVTQPTTDEVTIEYNVYPSIGFGV